MIVAGFGCRNGADVGAIRAVFDLACKDNDIAALATLTDKAPLLALLASALDLPLILIEPQAVAHRATFTHSHASLAAYRTGSVAEAVALAAAGSGARLLSPRIISPDRQATCALAQGISA